MEQKFLEYTIKLTRHRSAKRTKTGVEYKDLGYDVNIDYKTGAICFFIKEQGGQNKTLKKVFKTIKDELYL